MTFRSGAPILLVLATIATAQEGNLSRTLPVREVASVRIEGLSSLDPSALRGQLRLAPGDRLTDEGILDRQRETLRGLLRTGLLRDASIASEDSAGKVVVRVRVVEHPRAASVELDGEDDLSEDELRPLLRIRPEAIASPASLESDRQTLLRHLRSKGYLLSEVTVRVGDPLPDGRVTVVFAIEEGDKVRIRDISFTGVRNLAEDDLRAVMQSKERRFWRSGSFSEDTLRMDLEALVRHYRQNGFLDARVDSHRVRVLPGERRLTVGLHVNEGRQYRRGRVSFSGMEVLDERQLRSALLIDSGEVLDATRLEMEEFQLHSAYREEGRLFARINPVRTFRDTLVDIHYALQEGPPVTVRRVDVIGNTKTRDKVVRRELRIFPGDLYRQSLLQRSVRDVMQLAFFDSIAPDIRPGPEESGTVDVVFEIFEKERGTGTFSAGGAFSQRDGFVGTLSLQVPNIFGRGQQVDLSLEYGQYRRHFRAGLAEPWFRDTPTRLGGGIFWTDLEDQYSDGGNFRSYGFDLSLGRRLTWPDDYTSVSLSYSFSDNSYGYTADRMGRLRTDGIESSVALSLVRDDKDLPIFPTSGSRYRLRTQRVGGPLGGGFDYWNTTASAEWWMPAVWKLTLAVSVEGGVLQGQSLQQSDLFRMGGMLGFRGKLRGYSPGAVGAARLGRSYLAATTELRWPVAPGSFYLITFADAGNVFGEMLRAQVDDVDTDLVDAWEEIDPSSLRRDVGFGFRLMIPMMGILGFDFAWGLDDDESYTTGQPVPNPGMQTNFVIETGF